jgi:hypothetical protein
MQIKLSGGGQPKILRISHREAEALYKCCVALLESGDEAGAVVRAQLMLHCRACYKNGVEDPDVHISEWHEKANAIIEKYSGASVAPGSDTPKWAVKSKSLGRYASYVFTMIACLFLLHYILV